MCVWGRHEFSVEYVEPEGSVDSPAGNALEAAEFVARSKEKVVGLVMAIWYLLTNTLTTR